MTGLDEGRELMPGEMDEAIGPHTAENPRFVACAWWNMVRYQHHLDLASALVTPESQWSTDFAEEHLRLTETAGVSDLVEYVAPQVCWVRLPGGVQPNREYAPRTIRHGLILTLVHRPDLPAGGWRIHHLGEYLQPGEIST